MEQPEYLKDLATMLLKYRRDRFLCDLVVLTTEGRELYAHCVVMATASNKLRAAFEQQRSTRRNFLFRLNLPECETTSVEVVLHFLYVGSLPGGCTLDPDHVTAVLTAGQKLGLDVARLAQILSAYVALSEPSSFEFPPFVLADEDMFLEIIERDAHPARTPAVEIIRLTSKEQKSGLPNGLGTRDHCYDYATECLPTSPSDTGLQSSGNGKPSNDIVREPFNDVEYSEDKTDYKFIDEGENSTRRSEAGTEMDRLGNFNLDAKEESYNAAMQRELLYSVGGKPAAQSLNGYSEEESCKSVQVNNDDLSLSSNLFYAPETDSKPVKTESDWVALSQLQSDPSTLIQGLVYPDGSNSSCTDRIKQNSSEQCPITEASITRRLLSKPAIRYHAAGMGGLGFAGRRRGRQIGVGVATRERVILVCDHCGKSFHRAKEYTEHRRMHTGEKPFACDVCGKMFGRRRTMMEHRRIHTGDRPYLCDVCEKRFATSGELVKHYRFHTGERPYQCDVCGKTFSRCGESADHRRMHAGELTCQICGREFTRLHNMKEHLNSAHSGEKRFRCDICGKCFAYSSGLRYHRRLHREDRPFNCQLCGKAFSRAGELGRHERSAHKSHIVEIELYA